MFESIRNFWRRHRTKILISAGFFGATYFACQYVLGKLTEARKRMADDKIARENLRRRFEQNQEDCTYTTLALLPTVTENCMAMIPVQETLQELQTRKSEKLARSTASSEFAPSEDVPPGNGDEQGSIGSSGFVHASRIVEEASQDFELRRAAIQGKTRVQLWNDLKITSVTQAFTLIYTLALLTLFTRIQLNLLGRRNYLSSVVSLASPERQGSGISLENHDDDNLEQDYGNDFETNRKYLTFSWWLLHRGWEAVMRNVESAVRDVFASVTPRDNISLEKLAELTLEVRKRVEGATEEERRSKKWLEYLLPPAGDEAKVLAESGVSQGSPSSEDSSSISPSLKRLLDETSDLIDSPTFSHVITLLLDAGFSLLIDEKVANEAYQVFSSLGASRIQEISDESSQESGATKARTTKLANVLAAFTRQAPAIGSGGNISAIMSGTSTEIPGLTGPSIKDANEYLAAMEAVRDLEAFAAVVYSSNFEFEGVDAVDGQQFLTEILPEAGLDDGMIDPEDALDLTLESAWEKAVSEGDARSE